jgi:hypothetical protein
MKDFKTIKRKIQNEHLIIVCQNLNWSPIVILKPIFHIVGAYFNNVDGFGLYPSDSDLETIADMTNI